MNDRDDSDGTRTGGTELSVDHRWDEFDHPTVAILECVAAATNRRPTNLPTLHETIDTDALDSLLCSMDAEGSDSVEITFRYAGVDVVIEANGALEVRTTQN